MELTLWDEIIEKRALLSSCIESLMEHGIKASKAEHNYKIALRKEMYRLREDEKVAWTAVANLSYGDLQVAKLRMDRDIYKVTYDAAQEKINGLKLELRILESQLNREWGNAVK